MNAEFCDNELLFRAVWPPDVNDMYWKDNGKLSSAAFMDKNGVSVTRDGGRPLEKVVEYMKTTFSGYIVSLKVFQCYEVDSYVKYLPEPDNDYHSEIHGSKDKVILSKGQARRLAAFAKIEYSVQKI
jgi:hypothetical protein